MSVDLGRNRLFKEFETLRLRWGQTEHSWKDVVRQDFEKEHWNHLESMVLTTTAAADRLAPIIVQIRQDCSRPGEY